MRLIDADALSKAMYDEAFENDESYNETNPMARWDSGLWIRYKMFEKCLKNASTIEPNLVLNPDEIERGDVVEIGENIVVMHHDDYYDMFLKSELYDDIEPCEDAISREGAIRSILGLTMYKGAIPMDSAIFQIKSLPSVAPSRPSGEWITEERDSIYGKKIRLECPVCGDVFFVTTDAFPYERYCRYCGAKMKGADDGEN